MTFTIRSAAALSASLTVVFAFAAQAQTAAAPATPVDVPPITCDNPGSAPLDKASPQMGRFSKRVDEYKNCVNAYVSTMGNKANDLANQSKAYGDAANKAIDDYNTYVNKLNDATKSTKGGTEKNTN